MITSMQNKTVKELLKLKQKKYRKDYYLVETNHLVEEAIKAKQTDLIISTEPVDLGVENLVVSKEIMEKLASTKTPQPIMARCFIQKDKKLVDGKRYLILDYLQDPGNIGTLIRTALAFGIDQVILSNECVDLYNDKLLRSMQGAHFHLSCLYGDLKKIIPALKEKGENPFVLDSKEPTADFREFLLGEVRYSSLLKQYPETAEALFTKTEQDAKERLNNYKRLAGKA